MIGNIIMHSILSLSVIAGLGLFVFLAIVIRDAIVEKSNQKAMIKSPVAEERRD